MKIKVKDSTVVLAEGNTFGIHVHKHMTVTFSDEERQNLVL